jgi:hypothetical protein
MRTLLLFLLFGGVAGSAYAQDWTKAPDCTEYLPSKGPCQVTIPILDVSNAANPAPTHTDVTIKPGGAARVVLTHASPLMTCTIASTPAALTRDVSTSVTTFIGTLATVGVPGSMLPLPAGQPLEFRLESLPGDAGAQARKIDADLSDIEAGIKKSQNDYEQALRDYRQAKATVISNWKYSYATESAFQSAATTMYTDLQKAFADPLPTDDDLKPLNQSAASVGKALDFYARIFSDASGRLNPPVCQGDMSCAARFQSWYESARSRLLKIKSTLDLIPVHVKFLTDLQAVLKPGFTWLNSMSTPAGSGTFTPDPLHPWTTIYLPMSIYAQKQVTEAITCKDVATQVQAFDAITFTAYYEPAASWDLSAAAFVSLIPSRELGTISGPPPASATILAVTNSGPVQFVPGAVFEIHPSPLNFRCPWAKEGTGYHPWGYVCSFGPAGGFLINPNNGTTQAEFFEGVSFGIHRVAILIGNHTGRFQEFTEGYQIGQTVPAGTTPPTTRRWTNHPAFGICFRIPVR